jgi:hypothetical protein
MRQHVIWIVGGATAVLGIAFAIPGGRRAATAYEPLTGKAWVLNGAALEAVASSSTISAVNASTEPAHLPVAATPAPLAQILETPKKPRRIASSRPAQAPSAPLPPVLAKSDVTSSSAPVIAAPPAASADVPQYALENVADRYEADESKYRLDRIATNAGVTLSLIGLERVEKAFVLKVAVANTSAVDFFVKGFVITATDQELGSHAIFRLMVESGRTREGYVMFSKPQTGAVVHIKLQEDGGKGRAFDTAIPYPF